MAKIDEMIEKFWYKWEPCDWPPITPSKELKDKFFADLQEIIEEARKEIIDGQ